MDDILRSSESALYQGECTYEPGDLVELSGIYAICHGDGSRHTVALIRGNRFAGCECCGAQVRYRLIRSAPYILDDQDFSPPA